MPGFQPHAITPSVGIPRIRVFGVHEHGLLLMFLEKPVSLVFSWSFSFHYFILGFVSVVVMYVISGFFYI